MPDEPAPPPGPFTSIADRGRALREGRTTCAAILEECLDQIDRHEGTIQAWVVVDRAGARRQARRLDLELAGGLDKGPLHGMPIAIKDVVDAAGLTAARGAERWSNRAPEHDADLVRRLRQAGAVVMGKTVTTPYAWIDPPPTKNPWNLGRTPGGSSSGSAAAAAAGMCAAAIGTQTGGSIVRPASYCGAAGFKPTRGAVSTQGVFPFAESLDHPGPIARRVSDLHTVFQVITRFSDNADPVAEQPPRLGRLRGFFDRRAGESARIAIDHALAALITAGATVIDVDDPLDFDAVLVDHHRVMAREAAILHSDWLDEFPGDYPPRIRALVIEGRAISDADYRRARESMAPAAALLHHALSRRGLDALATPATTGPAPDPSTTGDPAFNSPFSFTGLPTVSFPVGLDPEGLPLALQLIGPRDHDFSLLNHADWCERAIRDQALWRDSIPAALEHNPGSPTRRRP